ncbi:MAG: glycosyltransferase family 4 protein [Nitrospinae bacterium]|nr:glycosyltransferase family 4 protein [Nitrospinota bacterium]
MRILIDARVISDKMHGIARYTYNLIKNLSDIDTKNEYVMLSNHDRLIDFSSGYKNFKLVRCNTPLYSIQEQFKIPKILKREGADIYHSPTFSAPLYQQCKTIMTVHDMIHLVFGKSIHRLYYRYIVKTAMMKASSIITVSEYSKTDIVKYLGIPKEKIYVTYNGIDEKFRPVHNKTIDNIKKKYGIFSRYILFVGNQKPHKNVDNILKAFKMAMEKEGLNHHLILVGVKNGYIKIAGELDKRVIYINNHTDDDLVELYQSADLFLSPSLYEGFGLPMLEAMACGVPVVTSNRTSIPEVTGNAAILADPENIQEIANAICKVLKDENLKSDLIRKGLEQAKMFSWKRMAEETLELYKRVYESSNNP